MRTFCKKFFTLSSFFIMTGLPFAAHADCIDVEPANTKIKIASCEVLTPLTDPRFKQDGNLPQMSDEFLLQFYKGALIKDEQGQSFMYPTEEKEACEQFTAGLEVEKTVSSVCCDTGAWGKCILGGVFIYDSGGTPVNTFQ
ncbi:MAG: hypothetical protein KDI90_12255 [Alphaproteobacteria bacterium]|nr:hypothetical protein [Alphaproteobacteria bacterium]MCB9975705.1 hypothetical protein [Rhodospirillales bacterium]